MDGTYQRACILLNYNEMILKLNISNFQSHKDTTLTFSPGVNVIVGQSDSGKTAILRALRWLIWNRPNGEAFRSDWGGTTSVEIVIPERHSIESGTHKDQTTLMRLKSTQNNQYLLNGTDHVYKAFGSSVPEEVQKVLNIDDTNLQKQFDSPFLISNTPGEVAAYFNKIAHLDQIDRSTSSVNSSISSLNSKKKLDDIRLKKLQESALQFEYLDKFEIDLENLEQMAADQIKIIQSKNGLQDILHQIAEVEEHIHDQAWIFDYESAVDSILKMYADKEAAWVDLDELQGTWSEIGSIESEIEYVGMQTKLLPSVEAILILYDDRHQLTNDLYKLEDAVSGLSSVSKRLSEMEVLLEEKETIFHDNMPDECPLCGETKSKT